MGLRCLSTVDLPKLELVLLFKLSLRDSIQNGC